MTRKSLERLLRPKSVAIIGGGAWCRNVIKTCHTIGFDGAIWPVHPSKSTVEGLKAYASIEDLPDAPDASFIGVNRNASIDVLTSLSQRGAGGAVCFASGFAEATAELEDGADLQARLLNAAADMPFLGPNCYGFLNYLDGCALWPDQHGGQRVQSGVAIITQSSNIAINLTMQNRAVPLASVVTAGNQAQVDLCEIGMALLKDPRVTCLGLHIEGINNIRSLEKLSNLSRELKKPICILKVGKSDQAQLASVSHTASLAGSHTGASALINRLGCAQVDDLSTFLEVLKIWHVAGPLTSHKIASASCSGGEASLMADLGSAFGLRFPDLTGTQASRMRTTLGPKVALANPLDYHTYIWPDKNLMQQTFDALFDTDIAIGLVVLDFPRADRCDISDWECALEAIIACRKNAHTPIGIVGSLPDTMPEAMAQQLIRANVIPFNGMDTALRAIALARIDEPSPIPILAPQTPENVATISEAEAKTALAKFGLRIPQSLKGSSIKDFQKADGSLQKPWVLKGLGLAHKSENGAVRVGLTNFAEVINAQKTMNCDEYLLEEMIENPITELLIAVTLDPAHGYVLTLGAGGTLTELLQDTTSLILPVTEADVTKALNNLRCAPILDGYRGAQAIDCKALWQAIDTVQNYVIAHRGQVQEVEINPLICTSTQAIAVDALIVQGDAQ